MKTSNIVGQIVVHLIIRYTQHVVFRIFNAPAPIKTTVYLNIFFAFSYKSLFWIHLIYSEFRYLRQTVLPCNTHLLGSVRV